MAAKHFGPKAIGVALISHLGSDRGSLSGLVYFLGVDFHGYVHSRVELQDVRQYRKLHRR
jgi:hypothetical protein